jgi:hypothetical protein
MVWIGLAIVIAGAVIAFAGLAMYIVEWLDHREERRRPQAALSDFWSELAKFLRWFINKIISLVPKRFHSALALILLGSAIILIGGAIAGWSLRGDDDDPPPTDTGRTDTGAMSAPGAPYSSSGLTWTFSPRP